MRLRMFCMAAVPAVLACGDSVTIVPECPPPPSGPVDLSTAHAYISCAVDLPSDAVLVSAGMRDRRNEALDGTTPRPRFYYRTPTSRLKVDMNVPYFGDPDYVEVFEEEPFAPEECTGDALTLADSRAMVRQAREEISYVVDAVEVIQRTCLGFLSQSPVYRDTEHPFARKVVVRGTDYVLYVVSFDEQARIVHRCGPCTSCFEECLAEYED